MIVLLLVLAPAFAAQDAPAGPDPRGLELFEKTVRPTLIDRCYSCHSAKADKLKGNLLLDTREGLRKGGDLGPGLVPGDPDRSLLIKALRWTDEALQMPPKKALPKEVVEAFETWVRLGAPDPRGAATPAADASKATNHWAFQPPRDVAPPAPGHPIDAFLLAELRKKGLGFSPEADRRTLVRRASFALTGLPPTAEELEADGPWEAVVDRLLASPRYGERWGRHWLDVARYADTKGYVYEDREESRFVHSGAYRDWVVRAFNDDLPYDRFLALQLAADQAGEPKDRVAMGFLTVGRRFINNVHDIIDDRIDTVTRGMLGLTVSCARCHDHKFDPVPTSDYYALYGVFHGSTERAEPLEAPAGDFAAELKKREEAWAKALEKRTKELLDRLRKKTPDYLVAALDVAKFPTEEFYEILGADDLKPFIVRRWAAYIDRFKGAAHPVWGAWHAFAAVPERDLAAKAPEWLKANAIHPKIAAALAEKVPASMKDVAAAYGRAFKEPDEVLREILEGPDSPVATPQGHFSEIEWFFDENIRQELGKLQREIERHIITAKDAPPWASYLADKPVLPTPRVFRRGNPANKGEEVPRRWLSVFGGRPFTSGSGRLELAKAVASPDNPLTARVWVNRVWMHQFGQGIVRTPSDFGLRSEAPTHPELLDWLARRHVADGWSTKKLQRLILTSAAWRQSSGPAPAADPENRLLSRYPRRRLDFEATRDALLATSGKLDLAMGGRSVNLTAPPFSGRRTIYGFVDRLNLPSLYRNFDLTGADAHIPQRFTTTTPQQALFLMNSPFLAEQSRALLARVDAKEPEARVRALYRLVHGRAPSARELARSLAFTAEGVAEPVVHKPGPWRYGYGEIDAAGGRVRGFTPLPRFTGSAWQGGDAWPDKELGWVTLNAQGGHVGNDLRHAAVRRWVAPRAGTVSITGALAHRKTEGDGVRGFILSESRGLLASWTLHNLEGKTELKGLPVKAGEALDFAVDCGTSGNITWDEFFWAPVIKMEKAPASTNAAEKEEEWSAAAQFAGPPPAPLDAWGKLAQTLLLSNEFVFVD